MDQFAFNPELAASAEVQDANMAETDVAETGPVDAEEKAEQQPTEPASEDKEQVPDADIADSEVAETRPEDAEGKAEQEPTEPTSEDKEEVPDADMAEKDIAETGPEDAEEKADQEPNEEKTEVAVGETEAQPEAQANQWPPVEPQKPKKPSTAYFLFTTSIREEVMKEAEAESGVKPGIGPLAKLISARWAALSDDDKKVWKEEKSAADKQRYEAAIKRYDAEMVIYLELLDPVGTLRTKYQHLIPTKPTSFFGLFLEDPAQRKKAAGLLKFEGKEATKPHLMKKLGELWRSASAEEKAKFQEQSQREQAEFVEKQKAWESTPEFTELERVTKEHKAVEEAARLESEAKEEAKKTKKSPKDTTTPKKRASAGPASSPPDAKKPKVAAEKKEKGPVIDEAVLLEATKLGWETSFRNLATRPEVLASGKSAGEILECLRVSGGLVNPAKRALLGCSLKF